MFHVGGHKGVGGRGRSSGLGRHYPHFLDHVNWKGPLRCGIIFCTISCLLFVIGVILTWLGIRRRVHDVLGESVPITGPILLAVGGLMLILALRQFYMAHVRKKAHNKAVQNKELTEPAAAALTEDHDDLDFTEAESNSKPSLNPAGYYNHHATSYGPTPASGGGYMWPPVPLQNTFYSMAMMAYRDPKLLYGLYLADTDRAEAGAADTGKSEDSSSSTAATGDPPVAPPTTQQTAVLETPSSTIQQQTLPSLNAPSTSHSTSRQEFSKIFPSDQLKTQPHKGNVASGIASAGIGYLPNPTAFMMLRTLELQETI